ncbi:MAG: hypothetical protein D3908_06135 [Candidatus Electrothrix sp. AUS4]|nr:hypothetical protein [Candidatus Electrothrix sp. AUS4]
MMDLVDRKKLCASSQKTGRAQVRLTLIIRKNSFEKHNPARRGRGINPGTCSPSPFDREDGYQSWSSAINILIELQRFRQEKKQAGSAP